MSQLSSHAFGGLATKGHDKNRYDCPDGMSTTNSLLVNNFPYNEMHYICEWRCHGKSGVDGGVCNPTDHQRSHLHYATHQQKQCDMSDPTLEYSCTLDTSVAWHTSRVTWQYASVLSSLLPLSQQAGLRGGMYRADRNEGLREREREANIDLKQQRNAFKNSRCNLTK